MYRHLHFAAQRPSGDQSRFGLEGDGADLGLHLAPAAGFALLGFVQEREFERRDAGGRQAQGAELKQPAAQLDPVQQGSPRRAP